MSLMSDGAPTHEALSLSESRLLRRPEIAAEASEFVARYLGANRDRLDSIGHRIERDLNLLDVNRDDLPRLTDEQTVVAVVLHSDIYNPGDVVVEPDWTVFDPDWTPPDVGCQLDGRTRRRRAISWAILLRRVQELIRDHPSETLIWFKQRFNRFEEIFTRTPSDGPLPSVLFPVQVPDTASVSEPTFVAVAVPVSPPIVFAADGMIDAPVHLALDDGAPPSSGRPADPPREQVSPVARAIAFMFDHQRKHRRLITMDTLLQLIPDISRTALYDDDGFKAARAAAKKSLLMAVPKGHRTQDGVEAEDCD